MKKNIVIANDLVYAYTSAHSTEKKMQEKQKELKQQLLDMGLGTYIYKGVEKVTNCVTVYETHTKKIRVTNQIEFDRIQKMIDTLKAEQEQYTEVYEIVGVSAKVTPTPKGINEMLKNGEI